MAIFRGNSTVMKCGWGPSELRKRAVSLEGTLREGGREREMCVRKDSHQDSLPECVRILIL